MFDKAKGNRLFINLLKYQSKIKEFILKHL